MPTNEPTTVPASSSAPAHEPATPQPSASRYAIAETDGVRYVQCESSPNIRVFVERGLSVDEDRRKKYPSQTIFLDGVFTGPPFLDNERRQYSLDHHGGACPRSFLLATCEQAVVMVLEGLPLDDRDWCVYINTPDLDAVLAAWVLLNHAPLRQKQAKLLFDVMPLIRVEGVIDAHGTEKPALAGLPPRLWDHYRWQIDTLRAREIELKKADQWEQTDLVAYTQDLLTSLDLQLFPSRELQRMAEIKETGRVTLPKARLAILTASKQGIYAVEEALKQRFRGNLALIVLDPGNGHMTLRQVDPFLPKSLNDLYPVLSKMEPDAQPDEHWGGSDSIGGAPRLSGTRLSGREILDAVAQVYGRREGWWRKLIPWPRQG